VITLTEQRQVADCNVYRDDVDLLTWYIMPQGPTVALTEDGKPIFSLVWYRRPVERLTEEERKTRLGGGILTFSVELKATDDQLEAIRREISEDPALQQRLDHAPKDGPDYRSWWAGEARRDPRRLAEALKVTTVPISDGNVAVAVLAETGGEDAPGEFVSSLVGAGRVSMTGSERASFMAKLTQDGAVLLWDMIERNLPAIRVAYDLRFNHRLDAVRMIVSCDVKKAYTAVQEQWAHIQDDASWSVRSTDSGTWYTFSHDESTDAGSRISQTARDAEAVHIEIIPEAGPDVVTPEQIQELTQLGNQMVQDFLSATFLQWDPGSEVQFDEEPELETELARQDGKEYGHHGIDYYKLKTWTDDMQATLAYDFKSKAVVEGHLGPNDSLADVLAGHRVEELRTQIEIDAAWYRYLDVMVLCTADFDEDPVDLVKAHFEYRARGSQGDIDSVADLVFQKDTPPQHFATYLAAPDKNRYGYEFEVFYKGTDESYVVQGDSNETILVLDTDRMGILRVEVQMGIIDWTVMKSVLVHMTYGAGPQRRETEFALDATRQSQRWVEVIAAPVTEPYTYQLTFVDASGQRLEMPAETSRSKQLVINQPTEQTLEVVVVAAGSFEPEGPLAQVLVALRYFDDDHNYRVDDVVTLVKEGDSKTWSVPLLDPNLRRYEYQVTVLYSDGVTREDGWQASDKEILPVGDPFDWRVQISPYLLKNPPGKYQFGTIHLAFDDPESGIHAEKDLEIIDFTKPLFWRFRLGSKDRHTYRYQLRLFTAEGTEVDVPQKEESGEVLVLVPPAG
jgi:hypothetical protein